MPIIKPSSSLRNKYDEISKIARENKEPIFLTRNGEGDLVVMSIELYDELIAKNEIIQKLYEGELQRLSDAPRRSGYEIIKELREKHHET